MASNNPPTTTPGTTRRVAIVLIKLGFSVGLIMLVTRGMSWSGFLAQLKTCDWRYLGGATGALIAAVMLGAWRWQRLLDALDFSTTYTDVARRIFVCLFFNVFVPGGVAGEFVRIFSFAKRNDGDRASLGTVAASVTADRGIGLVALSGLAVLGVFLWFKTLLDPAVVMTIYGFTAVIGGIGIFALTATGQIIVERLLDRALKRMPSVLALGTQFVNSYRVYRQKPRVIIEAIVISIGAHLLSVYSFYALACALSLDIEYVQMLTCVPIIVTLSCIPITIGGIGVREATTTVLFAQIGIGKEAAVAVALLYFVVQLGVAAAGGVAYLMPNKKR